MRRAGRTRLRKSSAVPITCMRLSVTGDADRLAEINAQGAGLVGAQTLDLQFAIAVVHFLFGMMVAAVLEMTYSLTM